MSPDHHDPSLEEFHRKWKAAMEGNEYTMRVPKIPWYRKVVNGIRRFSTRLK